MSTRRRVGVSLATSEAARRQLMQATPCWQKVWALPDNAPPGSTIKVYKWVKTNKVQQFSDDEGDVDEPLAPLPDEPEVVEGDEEEQDDKDEGTPALAPDASREVSELPPTLKEEGSPSKAASPKPHPLSMSFQPEGLSAEPTEDLENPLQSDMDASDNINIGETMLTMDSQPVEGEELTLGTPQEVTGDMDLSIPEGAGDGLDLDTSMNVEGGDGLDLDLSGLGPDGEAFESAHDLSQMEAEDALLGGNIMDASMDPFAQEPS